jgi:hypothetical protein
MSEPDSRTKLSISEQVWVARTNLLNEHGYVLRPRYRPGWSPSWNPARDKDQMFEDALTLQVSNQSYAQLNQFVQPL